MKRVLIETYRGFDIEFDPNDEKFKCICSEDNTKESGSFSAVKKFVDEYKKINQDFKPFWVQPIPGNMFVNRSPLKIIGVRKDGRFMSEDPNGKKGQISDYELLYYMLEKDENKTILNEINELDEKMEEQRIEYSKNRDLLISKLNVVNLQTYKELLKEES